MEIRLSLDLEEFLLALTVFKYKFLTIALLNGTMRGLVVVLFLQSE